MPHVNLYLDPEEEKIVNKCMKDWKQTKHDTIKQIIIEFDELIKEED